MVLPCMRTPRIILRGTKANRNGVGARIKIATGNLTLIDEVNSGRSYQSGYGLRLHFGLGHHQKLDRIEVRWVGGGVDIFQDVAVNQCLTLTEGASKAEDE